MRRRVRLVAVWFLLLTPAVAAAQDVLEVRGNGVEGRPAYRGGGVVRFLDMRIVPQVVHFDGTSVLLPLEIDYDVEKPAPILLTSRLGSEYWRLYAFDAGTMTSVYTNEKIDLSSPGRQTARATRATFGHIEGPPPKSGLAGIRGRSYFLIDQPGGRWLDVVDSPLFFEQTERGRRLTFTMADVSKEYDLAISELQSTWQPGGRLRVRVTLTDAMGKRFPVVNVPLVASGNSWRTELATEWSALGQPSGWLVGTLPQTVPSEVAVEGAVTVQTPGGVERREISATFGRGDGLKRAEEMQIDRPYVLPRNADGIVRETRAVWVNTRDIATAELVDTLVQRCTQARLNVIVPDIFVGHTFMATSDLMPTSDLAKQDVDPLRLLIEKAHAAGLEVHPWFCVTYRDAEFRRWFHEKHGTNVDIVGRKGKPNRTGADVHRTEYRQFIVELMVGVARDYEVDGIHLDYIRTMDHCYCDKCREEFAAEFGKPLAEATADEWLRWQREAVGDIVRRTADGVRAVRPGAIISAAVFSNMHGGAIQGQDPAAWAANGWLDLVLPMDYQMQTLQVAADERQFLDALADDDKLVTGLSLYMRSDGKALSRPPELVANQIELVRHLGIHGYCLFAYNYIDDAVLEALRDRLNAEQAVPYFR